MKKIFILLTVLFTAAAVSDLRPDNEGMGRTGAAFLKIPVGGRMLGMAEAFTAVADDPYALAGNVAGISRNRDLEISFSHLEWFGGVDCEYFGATSSFFRGFGGFDSTLGVAFEYLHVPDFPSYDDWGVQSGSAKFGAYNLMLGYAQKIGPLSAGVGMKMLGESCLGQMDGAAAFNLGLLFSFRLPSFRFLNREFVSRPVDLGFLLENWGLGTKVGGFPTPVQWKLGGAFRPFDPLLLAADFQLVEGNRFRLNVGGELNVFKLFYIRMGYRFFGYETDTYTIGLGGRITLGRKLVKADLFFAPAGGLGNTFGIALSMKYPGRISDEDRNAAQILYYRGIYYFTRGETEKAVEMWEAALKIDPTMAIAGVKISEARRLQDLQSVESSVKEKLKNENAEAPPQ